MKKILLISIILICAINSNAQYPSPTPWASPFRNLVYFDVTSKTGLHTIPPIVVGSILDSMINRMMQMYYLDSSLASASGFSGSGIKNVVPIFTGSTVVGNSDIIDSTTQKHAYVMDSLYIDGYVKLNNIPDASNIDSPLVKGTANNKIRKIPPPTGIQGLLWSYPSNVGSLDTNFVIKWDDTLQGNKKIVTESEFKDSCLSLRSSGGGGTIDTSILFPEYAATQSAGYGLAYGGRTFKLDTATVFPKYASTQSVGCGLLYGGRTFKLDSGTVATYIRSTVPSGGSSYTFSGGVTNTGGTVTNDLITPTSGSKTIIGGTAATDFPTIKSTSGNQVGISGQHAIDFTCGNNGGTIWAFVDYSAFPFPPNGGPLFHLNTSLTVQDFFSINGQYQIEINNYSGTNILRTGYQSPVQINGDLNTYPVALNGNGGNTLVGTLTDNSNGVLQVNGNITLETAGNKISITGGTNGTLNDVTLSSGAITVSNTSIVTGDKVIAWYTSGTALSIGVGGISTAFYVPTITSGTSFVINALTAAGIINTTDNSTITYFILHKN